MVKQDKPYVDESDVLGRIKYQKKKKLTTGGSARSYTMSATTSVISGAAMVL